MIDLVSKNNNNTKNISTSSKGSHFIKSCQTCLKCSPEYSKGSLLLELLIAISLIAIILSFSANAMFLSMRSNKTSGDRNTASSLASEALEAARSVSEEDYYNIYELTKGSSYHPVVIGGKWTIDNSSSEQITMNNVLYTRFVVFENVCRDDTLRTITGVSPCGVGSSDDPGTQKATATVSWLGGDSVVISEYFSRWKNKICDQSGWATGGTGNTIKNCGDTTYDTKDTEIDTAGGTLKLQ